MIKLSSPNISEEAIHAVEKVLRSGNLVHGEECELFEEELASYLGTKHVALVSSGTAALHVALMALDIGPGDAVLVPNFTFPATANAVAMTGALPVMVDVDIETYNISVELVENILNNWDRREKIRAIIPVHEFGFPADIEKIVVLAKEHNLYVVEDAACALGATVGTKKVGTFGDFGCFSFHPRKTITTGEGGAIATNDDDLAIRIKTLRNHGMIRTSEGMQFVEYSTNYRMTNFQAALGRVQLPNLEAWIRKRRALAAEYVKGLEKLVDKGLISLPVISTSHSYQTFMVLLNSGFERRLLIDKLKQQGVETNLGAQCLSRLEPFKSSAASDTNSRRLAEEGLALPLYETLTLRDIRHICKSLQDEISDENN